MKDKWFDFDQQSFEFNLAYYWYNKDDRLTLYFIAPTLNAFIFFNGKEFCIKSTDKLPPEDILLPLANLNETSFPLQIKGIRQNEDGDFYLLLNDNSILKIYSAPDDVYDNRVMQLITLIEPKESNQQYIDTLMDYQDYSVKVPMIYRKDK